MARTGMLTERFDLALTYALHAHDGQPRKGTTVPYAAHLLGVASLALEAGGDEDTAIVALLHDVVEDVGIDRLDDIREQFGEQVADSVSQCSAEEKHTGLSWRERKQRYIAGIGSASAMAVRVSLADKVYNARSIVADFREVGDELWKRFNASGPDDVLWYYEGLLIAYAARRDELDPRLLHALGAAVSQLRELIDRPHCPECGDARVAPIVMGLPTAVDGALAEAGEFDLGGCVVSDNDPAWHCHHCDARFGRRGDEW